MGTTILRKFSWPSVMTALILCLLTLTVFGLTHNRGPESAIRRFHANLLTEKQSLYQPELAQNQEELNVMVFKEQVRRLLRSGAQVRMGRSTKRPPYGVVEVAYLLPDGSSWAILFDMYQLPRGWEIDFERTATDARSQFGG